MERSGPSADGQQYLPRVHRIARLDRDVGDAATPTGDDMRDHLHGLQGHQFFTLVDDLANVDMNRLYHAAQRRDLIASTGATAAISW